MKEHTIENNRAGISSEVPYRIATPTWVKMKKAEVAALRNSRENDPKATTTLLVPAAQHPLIDGKFPGTEFAKRLEAAKERYDEIVGQGGKVEFFIAGNRHYDKKSGQLDKVALYDAGGRWLVDHGISPSLLHGKDWIDEYRPRGLYSGAAEIGVTAIGFVNNQQFHSAEYFCSPGQESRAATYALAWSVPLTIKVPENLQENQSEQFHGNTLEKIVLGGLARTIDPYGEGVLARLTQDRIPADGNQDTLPELLPEYADLPWHENPWAGILERNHQL